MNRRNQHAGRIYGFSTLGLLLLITLFLTFDAGTRTETPPDEEAAEVLAAPENTNAPPETPEEAETPETPEDTETPAPVETLLARMTLREKVCQLFLVYPSSVTGTAPVTEAGEAMREGLSRWPVGGLLLDRSNLVTPEQARALLAGAQERSAIPLILTCDEEGGRVNRLMATLGTTWVGPMLSYRAEGTERAAENAATIARDLLSFGFNMDLAPVADVWSNPENTVIGDRAYSDDFGEAAALVAAAVEGFHRGGCACTLKHFPGHGDTSADSHDGSVTVSKTLDELRGAELRPFQAGIDAGADAVMLGHLILPDVSGEPVLFSSRIVTELLRGEMGFEGVILTDSLEMKAMTDAYGSGEIALRAVQAGVDLLLCPSDLDEAVSALLTAVEEGTLSETRIDESVTRILALKARWGMIGN